MIRKTLLTLICIFLLFSCDRHPLYIPEASRVNIKINIEANINILWNEHWKDSLLYDWDENKYGIIGYTIPNEVNGIFLYNDNIKYHTQLKTNQYNEIDINKNEIYNCLFFNQTPTTYSYYKNNIYYIESKETYNTIKSRVAEEYTTINQPGELFSYYLKNLELDKLNYIILYKDKQIYLYNIDITMNPISYIYIIQFLIIDDIGSYNTINGINSFNICGVTKVKNLMTTNPLYTGLEQITVSDIKGPQYNNDTTIYASRITVLDLYAQQYDNSSWNIPDNNVFYIILDLDTKENSSLIGIKDITKQLKENPKGGIITIKIYTSEIENNKNPEGFGITVKEWEEHIYDIPF